VQVHPLGKNHDDYRYYNGTQLVRSGNRIRYGMRVAGL
jgi:hypothetical protein